MKKILFIAPITNDACSFYRTGGIAPDLCKKLDADFNMISLEKERLDWQKMLMYDLVMFQRPFSDTTVALMTYLKKLGIPMWVDFDDLTLAVPVSNPAYEVLSQSRDNIIMIAKLADLVTVTTQSLAERLLEHLPGKEHSGIVNVVPNAFNDTIFKRNQHIPQVHAVKDPGPLYMPQTSTTVLWRGSDTHVADLMDFSLQIGALMEAYPEWKWVFFGMLPWFLPVSVKNGGPIYIPPTDPLPYHEQLLRIKAPVIHVPLEDNVFNRAKSNIAFIEAAYAGSVCVAPDWEEWRKPGVLNYKDHNGYMTAISSVLDGKVDIAEHVAASWDYITENLLLSKVNEKRAALVKKLMSW